MGKQDEIAYIERLGEDGRQHALGKPWSDPDRGRMLGEVGALLGILPPPPARVLDAGAGSGWTSCMLAMAGYSVVAADIAPDMIDLTRLNADRYRVQLDGTVVSDFESLPFADEFDAVVFYDCLHHAEDEVAALTAAHRALRAGGVCITLEPGVGHHKAEHSLRAMQHMGVTERDMPPSLIIKSGKAAGFRSFAIHTRPLPPVQLNPGWVPRLKAVVTLTYRYLSQVTPFARRRGHFVALHK